MTDPRTATEFRVPAIDLRKGDLVNTTPGEDDWQEVVGVYRTGDDALSSEVRTLVSAVGGRYVVVQLTDLAPVDGGVFFDNGQAMVYGDEDGEDQAVSDIVSSTDGVRTYLYTKYELVTVRSHN